jgi:hypothetical protein
MASDEQRPDVAFYSLLAEYEISASRPFVLPPEEQELFARLAAGTLFPLIQHLGEEVRKKGKPAPDKPYWQTDLDYKPYMFTHGLIDHGPNGEDWFSSSIHTYVEPEPLSLQGLRTAQVTSRLHLSNHVNVVSFGSLADGQITCANDDIEGSDRILDTTDSIFEPLPNKVYIAGNPALWLSRLVMRDTLERIEAQLALLPEVR